MEFMNRLRTSISKLPDKKQYIELVTAVMTIPVLATVIILNLNNLRPKPSDPTPKEPVQERVVYISPSDSSTKTSQTVTECKKTIAPFEIASPKENETITENPVSIDFDYTQGDYCSAVWSYRINDGRWSNFDDKSIALYNLAQGTVRLDVRVKSLATGQEKTYSRTFTYSPDEPVLNQDPTSSQSATQ
jgi:hypothetical protein